MESHSGNLKYSRQQMGEHLDELGKIFDFDLDWAVKALGRIEAQRDNIAAQLEQRQSMLEYRVNENRELVEERDQLRGENNRLEAERDECEQEAERYAAEAEAAYKARDELKERHHEGECADLRVELHDVYQRAYRAERERDELRYSRNHWMREAERWERLAVEGQQEDWEQAERMANRVPRIISAEELREGQEVAIVWSADRGDRLSTQVDHVASAGEVEVGLAPGVGGWISTRDIIAIVVLSDVPEPAPVAAEDIRNSEPGSMWEDNEADLWKWDGKALQVQCKGYISRSPEHVLKVWGPLLRSTAAPRGTYPKRLTVDDLDAAEVGSVLANGKGFAARKTGHGDWLELGSCNMRYSNEDLMQWPHATLTPPEKPERRGEKIKPEELRAGDVVDGFTSKGNFSVRDMTITRIVDGVAHDDNKHWNFPHEGGWSEIRLVHRAETYACPDCGETVKRVEDGGS